MHQLPALSAGSLSARLSRRRFVRGALGVAGAVATTLLVACGGKTTAGGADPIVQMTKDNTFDQNHVTVLRGYQVVWTNVTKDTMHTATCDPSKAKNAKDVSLPKGAQPFDSGDVAPDTSWSYTFTVPGEYVYFCKHHEADGMVGRITVEA